jgi:2-iminobutanoate/2-iminopropanoate deaminase
MPNFDVILTDAAPYSDGYSQAIRYGNMLLTSGMLGINPNTGRLVPGGVGAELRQVMHNLQQVLDAAGCTLHDVIRVDVALVDMALYDEMDQVYRAYFRAPLPTRTVVGVKELWSGACIGLDMWAIHRE